MAYIYNNPIRGTVMQIPAAALSHALHNPAFSRLLTQGLKTKFAKNHRISKLISKLEKIPGAEAIRTGALNYRVDRQGRAIGSPDAHIGEEENEGRAQGY